MIGRKGNSLAIAPGVFNQLEVKVLFPIDLLKKKVLGYTNVGIICVLYEEGGKIVKVPFAKNRKWFQAMVSEPEWAALASIPQIYVV